MSKSKIKIPPYVSYTFTGVHLTGVHLMEVHYGVVLTSDNRVAGGARIGSLRYDLRGRFLSCLELVSSPIFLGFKQASI